MTRRGFTLLETIVALAILGLALMAIFDLNAGAIASHAYTKRLTVATMLARGKMTDLEQKLHDQGMAADDDEDAGDFSEEGWSNYRWRARILAPKTQNVSTDKVIAALFNIPGGGDLSSLFSGAAGAAASKAAGASGASSSSLAAAAGGMLPPGATPGGNAMGASLIQGPVTQLVDQLSKSVREVHLTVLWKDGESTESLDVVTHVVSLGPGSDRNIPAGMPAGGLQGTGVNGAGLPGGLPGAAGAANPLNTFPGLPGQPRLPGLYTQPGGQK